MEIYRQDIGIHQYWRSKICILHIEKKKYLENETNLKFLKIQVQGENK